MSDYTALATSPLDLPVGFTLTITGCLALLYWAIIRAARVTCAERDRLDAAAMREQAADWGESTREQVEWELHVAQAVALSETPIYEALSREQFEADALDEIEEMTGGGWRG